jgi:hypothetical protein
MPTYGEQIQSQLDEIKVAAMKISVDLSTDPANVQHAFNQNQRILWAIQNMESIVKTIVAGVLPKGFVGFRYN